MADKIQKAKKTKKQRKYGRNAASCQRYRLEMRGEKSQLRRLRKHIKRFSADRCAERAISSLETIL